MSFTSVPARVFEIIHEEEITPELIVEIMTILELGQIPESDFTIVYLTHHLFEAPFILFNSSMTTDMIDIEEIRVAFRK